MKKAVFAFIWIFFLAACLPFAPAPAPTVPANLDPSRTGEAALKTAIVLTLTAQPTNTSVPPASSATPTLTQEVLPSPTVMLTLPTAVQPTLAVPSGTFEAATSTGLAAPLPLGTATSTSAPGILTYGTLPPAVPYSTLRLINRSKTQAYISLQVASRKGGPTVLEYSVKNRVEVDAPVGNYVYVAWVGGRKMTGAFRLHQNEQLQVVLYRDRVEVS